MIFREEEESPSDLDGFMQVLDSGRTGNWGCLFLWGMENMKELPVFEGESKQHYTISAPHVT